LYLLMYIGDQHIFYIIWCSCRLTRTGFILYTIQIVTYILKRKINVACFPVSYSCTSLKCYMINVWKAIRIKSWELCISYIKRNICSSLISNEQSNVCVLISIYRPLKYLLTVGGIYRNPPIPPQIQLTTTNV
jgi:hypothetical protein